MSNSSNARKYLTEDELKRLLHVIKGRKSARDEAIFLVTYWRGLRASDVGRIPVYRLELRRIDHHEMRHLRSRLDQGQRPGR